MRVPDAAAIPSAVVLTIGTELAEGLRHDTNGPEISRRLAAAGYLVAAREVLPDDRTIVAGRISAHLDSADLVVVTGGLGPTHDDVTREAAADALGLTLQPDEALLSRLKAVRDRHSSSLGREQVMRQALVMQGAHVLRPSLGTAPGQFVRTPHATVILLPGPPAELRPMLAEAFELLAAGSSVQPRLLRCALMMESDAQAIAEDALRGFPGISLTILATPALLDLVLIDREANERILDEAAGRVADALGDACYSTDGATLAEALVRAARSMGITIAVAESCTGGLVAASITEVPGASDVFAGGFVTYSDHLKSSVLGVDKTVLRAEGAVSEAVAREMAEGASRTAEADLSVAVTGIAGPGGGSEVKPVGTVWFALSGPDQTLTHHRLFSGDRPGIRARATVTALELLRRAITTGGPIGG